MKLERELKIHRDSDLSKKIQVTQNQVHLKGRRYRDKGWEEKEEGSCTGSQKRSVEEDHAEDVHDDTLDIEHLHN